MESQALNKLLGIYVIAASIAVSLFVSPWNSMDPVNLPKMVLLGVLGSIAASLAFNQSRFLKSRAARPFLIIYFLFLIQLTISLLSSPGDFSYHFYGTSSRNTGYFSYLSLSFLLIASAASAKIDLLKKYVFSILGVGTVLSIYGLWQSQGIDFFDYVNAYGSNVFGTFGNPNFQSAFMGITASVALSWALLSKIKPNYKFFLVVVCGLSILNISLSSEQGYLNFVAGFGSALIVYLFSKRKFFLGWVLVLSYFVGVVLVFLGITNVGPLADILYKSSLQARGFYWRAAIKMMLDKPLTGVGLDGFGDWYLRNRNLEIAQFNAGIKADTAHNIPLDIGSGGGVILLILYLLLVLLALKAVIVVVRRSIEFDPIFTSIIAAWVAYQAQSLISINQLGLGVWGWSLTGLLIGYEINTRIPTQTTPQISSRKVARRKEQIPALAMLSAALAGGIGLAVSLPPYLAANKYYKALQSGDGVILEQSAYLKPNDRTRYIYTAQILAANKLEDRAIKVLLDASKIYPDSFEIWQQLAGIPSVSESQKAKALVEMKRLDPFNPTLK